MRKFLHRFPSNVTMSGSGGTGEIQNPPISVSGPPNRGAGELVQIIKGTPPGKLGCWVQLPRNSEKGTAVTAWFRLGYGCHGLILKTLPAEEARHLLPLVSGFFVSRGPTVGMTTPTQLAAKYPTTVKVVKLSRIQPNTWNPNVLEPAMMEKLKLSIQRLGFVTPLVLRQRGKSTKYTILDGEHRWKALKALGFVNARCIVFSSKLPDDEAKILTVAANEIHGESNDQLLHDLFQSIEEIPLDEMLELLPFGESFHQSEAEVSAEELEEAVRELTTEPKAKKPTMGDDRLAAATDDDDDDEPHPDEGCDAPSETSEVVFDVPTDMVKVIRKVLKRAKRGTPKATDGEALVAVCMSYTG